MLRYVLSLMAAFAAAVVLIASQGGVAYASFHCIRIHAVMGGYNGNANIQYVELRQDVGGQNFVQTHILEFYDASNALKATFTFPTSVTNGSLGDSILIATSEFNTAVMGGTADYVFTNANTTGSNLGDPLHPVQAPGGKVYWARGSDNCDGNVTVSLGEADSVAYGGGSADWTPSAIALPNPSTNKALVLNNLNQVPASNNAEYGLANVATAVATVTVGNLGSDLSTPRNNGRTVLKLPMATVGGIDAPIGAADNASPLATSGGSSDGHGVWYAMIAAAALLVLTGGGAGLYLQRQRRPDRDG